MRYRRTFKQAQANGLRPTGRELYPEAPARKIAGPKKVTGPKLTSKKPFPFQRKATDQEIEELQKRREPENIEMFQLSKDALLDLARQADLKGRSAMTKGQLITALRKKPIEEVTPEELKAVAEAPLAPLILPRTTEEKADKKTMIKEYVRLSAPAFVPAKFKLGPRRLESLSNESLGSRILGLQKFLHDRNERAKRDFGERKQREEEKRLADIALQEAQDIEAERLEARRVEDERRRNLEAKWEEAKEIIANGAARILINKKNAQRLLVQKVLIARDKAKETLRKRKEDADKVARELKLAQEREASTKIQSTIRMKLAKLKVERLKAEKALKDQQEAEREAKRLLKIQKETDERVSKEVADFLEKIVTNPPTTQEQGLLLIPKARELQFGIDTTSPEVQDSLEKMLESVLSLVQETISQLQKRAEEKELKEVEDKLARLNAEEESARQREQQRQELIKKIYDLSKQTSTPYKNTNPLKKLSTGELGEIYNRVVAQQQAEMMPIAPIAPIKPEPPPVLPPIQTQLSNLPAVKPNFSVSPELRPPAPTPAPVQPQAPAQPSKRDLAKKIVALREELGIHSKDTVNNLSSTKGIDALKDILSGLEKTKRKRDEDAQKEQQQYEQNQRAQEAKKAEEEKAYARNIRRGWMYDILGQQRRLTPYTLEELKEMSDEKLQKTQKEVTAKFAELQKNPRNQIRQSTVPNIPDDMVFPTEPEEEEVDISENAQAIGDEEGEAVMEEPQMETPEGKAEARAQATTLTQRRGKGANAEQFGIDNHSIDEFLSKYGNEYLGCIAHDEIPSKIYPLIRPRSRGFFVINTDPSHKPGMHWQCVFFDARPTGSGSIEFYDSFADPIDSKMQADLKGVAERLDAKTYLKLKENRVKQQNDNSDNCGYFCMNFITSRMRGKGFPEASGFDESVKGEADIHRFKKQNGFGFLPSFGSIASSIARPFTRAVKNTVERVKNVGQTIGNVAQNIKERIFFPEKKLPSSIQPLFEKYKNSKILSARIRREPILAFVDKFINLISFGKYDQAKKELGYDKMFHLSLILQLEPQSGAVAVPAAERGNGPNLLIEKNERINMTTSFKDGPQVQYSPASGSLTIPGNPTLGEFYEKTLKAIGDHRFFTYNAFDQNCQAFISDLLRSNGALTPEAETFVMQDAKTVAKQLPFFVSKVAQFATDTAGRVRQFFGFGNKKATRPRSGVFSTKVDKKIQRRVKFKEFMNKMAFSQKMK